MNIAGYITMGASALMIGFLALAVTAAIGWLIIPIAIILIYIGTKD